MNSSARAEVLISISTTSIAMVGISARMVRRREFAKARSTLPSVKSTRSDAAFLGDQRDCKDSNEWNEILPHGLSLEVLPPPGLPSHRSP